MLFYLFNAVLCKTSSSETLPGIKPGTHTQAQQEWDGHQEGFWDKTEWSHVTGENGTFYHNWCLPLLAASCCCVQSFWEWQRRRKRSGSIHVIPSTEDTEIFKMLRALSWHSESDTNFWKIEEPQGRLITVLLKNVRQLLPPTVKESE